MLVCLPSRHDMVCDFPLPCNPHINAEKGMFVLRNNLWSASAGVDISPIRKAVPSSPYCGTRLGSQRCSTSIEKTTASLISLFARTSVSILLVGSLVSRRHRWSSNVGILGARSLLLCRSLSPLCGHVARALGSGPHQ